MIRIRVPASNCTAGLRFRTTREFRTPSPSINLDSGISPFGFLLFHSCMAWMAMTA